MAVAIFNSCPWMIRRPFAESLLVTARLPAGFIGRLRVNPKGLGDVLAQSRLETRRELLWLGHPAAAEWIEAPDRSKPLLTRSDEHDAAAVVVVGQVVAPGCEHVAVGQPPVSADPHCIRRLPVHRGENPTDLLEARCLDDGSSLFLGTDPQIRVPTLLPADGRIDITVDRPPSWDDDGVDLGPAVGVDDSRRQVAVARVCREVPRTLVFLCAIESRASTDSSPMERTLPRQSARSSCPGSPDPPRSRHGSASHCGGCPARCETLPMEGASE